MAVKQIIKTKMNSNIVLKKIWNFFRIAKVYIKVLPLVLLDNLFQILRKLGISRRYAGLKEFHNKYTGKRCFILATGPSMSYDDLEKLKNEYTFGVNSIASALENMSFVPTFYMIQDGRVFEKLQKKIEDSKLNKIFVGIGFCNFVKKQYYNNINCILYPNNCTYNYLRACKYKYDKFKFSEDVTETVYNGHTVVYSAIQMAKYMGFKEIYLLGTDCNYVEGIKNFEDHGVRDANAQERMLNSYFYVNEYLKNKEVKIYNATRGGKLEVFPRVDLDEVLKRTE